MTPPAVTRLFSPIVPEENFCALPSPEELVCRAQPAPAPSVRAATSLLPDFRAMAHASYATRLLERNRGALASSLLASTAPRSTSTPTHSIFDSSPLALSGWTFLGGAAFGCNHDPLDDMPPPGDPDIDNPSDDENPPVNTGGDNGGLGSGINPNFATGVCRTPVDLDPSSDGNSLLLTCADQVSQGHNEGNAILERINASTGAVTPLLLPNMIDNEPNQSVYTSSAASDGNGIVHVGFSADGTNADFTGGTRSLATSGIFIVPEADENLTQAVLFNNFTRILPGDDGRIGLAGIGPEASILHFTPNTPVSMTRVGNTLFAITRNQWINPVDGSIDLAPATILRYSINSTSGALTPMPIGAVQNNVVTGTSTPHNAYLMDGVFNPTAINSTADGRIVAITQGIPGENASSIHVFNDDMTSGITSGAGSSEIVITDPANPDYDFVANSSSQLSIVGNHAIVGSMDGSGRIAIVDISPAGPTGGATRTRFVTIFDDGSDIANVVVNPNVEIAYVISDTGAIRAVTLTEGDNFGKVGDIFNIASVEPGTIIPAAFRANSVIAARPLGYGKAPIN